jgi:arsenite/tail-anchored protein-transporting ATPase
VTSTAERSRSPQTRLQLFGGKGGVGKTTCAAAWAITAARSGLHTLLISVDPAHSLGDVLGVHLGPAPRLVPATRGRLRGVEIRASSIVRRWLTERRDLLEAIALRGTWLDRHDVSGLLELALPGIDELAALLEIARFSRSGRYELLVVDTAPTGHTLRMLDTPDALGGLAGVFDAMQSRHRVLVTALRGRWDGDAADTLIDDLDRDSRELAAMLRDPARMRAFWVTLPEPMAIEETQDALRALTSRSIPIEAVVVNRLTPRPASACRWCDARRDFEARALERLEGMGRGMNRVDLLTILDCGREPVGVERLAAIGRALNRALENPRRRRDRRRAPAARAAHPSALPARVPGRKEDRLRATRSRDVRSPQIQDTSARLLLFGGKGGVGKTTCAAAAALAIARAHPERRILLLSTDPAHSLSDALGAHVSDEPTALRGGPANLHVRELDAVAAFRRARDEYAAAIDGLFDRLLRDSAIDASHDRRVMQGLIDLAPPGVDELMAMSEVVETIAASDARRAHDLLITDTAPTGHALRLLEMPALVQGWTQALMRILLKYQPVIGVGALGEALLRLSRGMGHLRATLEDPSAAEFVVVTRPAELPRAETRRLLASLRRLHIPVSRVIVNAVTAGTCARCQRIAKAERREISALARTIRSNLTVTVAPAVVPPPHGHHELTRWHDRWESAPRTRLAGGHAHGG